MESDSDIHDVRTIASFRILPYCITDQTPRIATRPHARFVAWMERHNFPTPLPEQKPSSAAVALFNLLSSSHRHLNFDLRATPPTINVTLRVVLPNTIPAQLHPGDSNIRTILWHVTRFSNTTPPLASCGFHCDSSCLPSNDKKSFQLSHVFKPTTAHPKPRKRPRKPQCRFLNLPDDVLLKIIFLLDPKDYRVLSQTHPYLEDFLLPIVPGLKLHLFPHQLYALSRMDLMEKPRLQPFPLLELLPSRPLEYGYIMADLVKGSLLFLEEIPQVKLPVGGLFCDEPGLGKTITALSHVLKTMGKTPQPPSGRDTKPFTASNGREVFAYKETHINRLSSYGNNTDDFSSRDVRLLPGLQPSRKKRRSSRPVRLPDYFTSTKGLGSVPVVEGSRDIFLSGATMIAVPPVLVSHWRSQIEQHVISDMIKVLYIDKEEHLPGSGLELASYDIVLVSFEFLEKIYDDLRSGAHLLLQVHFFRLVVDEGHKLSASSKNRFISVCDRLRADVRWVMTGTPTPATPRSDIENLRDLLKFIKDEAYGLDEEAWSKGVKNPYSNYKKESLERLSMLMDSIMIRADKSILKAKCLVNNVFLKFSKDTADSYNGLVRMARRNLITADWFDPNHTESLLNPKKLADARSVMTNLRKACCFGGTMDVKFNTSDIAETLDELYEKFRDKAGIHEDDRFKDPIMELRLLEDSFGGDEEDQRRKADIQRRMDLYDSLDRAPLRLSRVKLHGPHDVRRLSRMAYAGKLQQIGEALRRSSCFCEKCGTHTKYPLVTPCGHLLCDECVVLDRFACPVPTCEVGYRMDEKDIPEDLIELQPSIQSHNWRNDWADTTSSKMSYLIKRIESLPDNEEWRPNEATPRMIPPKVIVHSQHGDHLKLVALYMKRSPKLCNAYVEMVVNVRDIQQDTRNIRTASEFAASSVKRFAEDPHAHILLMNSRHGAVGLDLSFVQYIFLLEPLWDAADELQIVSRAHRIGCKRDITVERLLMKNSVEQDMIADLQSSVNRLEDSTLLGVQDKAEKVQRKVSNLLKNLKVIRSDYITDGEYVVSCSSRNENGEVGHSSDSVPGSSEMDSSESRPPSLNAVPVPGGVLKRQRSERESSAEPRRRVRFRE